MRSELISALVCCTEGCRKARSRRFLQGLSLGELLFIAEYQGACVLEAARRPAGSRGEIAARVAQFQAARETVCDEHKTMLLLEYLCRTGAGVSAQAS